MARVATRAPWQPAYDLFARIRRLLLPAVQVCFTCDWIAGDRRWRWAQGVTCSQGGRRHHQRVFIGAAAALPANAESDFGRKEFHHHFPNADWPTEGVREVVDPMAGKITRRQDELGSLWCVLWPQHTAQAGCAGLNDATFMQHRNMTESSCLNVPSTTIRFNSAVDAQRYWYNHIIYTSLFARYAYNNQINFEYLYYQN